VVALLGGVCSCPSCAWHAEPCVIGQTTETEPLLTVEHSKNDGAQHRRRLTPGPRYSGTGQQWGRYLRVMANIPDHGLRLLCFNCHMAAEWAKRAG
jgi:hypothetical protein